MQFENPPLIELIAELRWMPSQESGTAPSEIRPGLPFPIFFSARQEEFFMRLASQVAQEGFGRNERIFPPGFPFPAFQTVYRFMKISAEDSNTLYQVGAGVFSAHALPPYKNWETFRPIVGRGVNLLLANRNEAEKESAFMSATLRYINLFSKQLIDNQNLAHFLGDTLGIKIELPQSILQQVKRPDQVQPQLRFEMPLKTGLTMNLSFSNGNVNEKSGILMDLAVRADTQTLPSEDGVMQTFELAHDSIRETFVGLTAKLHASMKLIE